MNNKKIILLLILLLLIGNLFFALKYFIVQGELKQTQQLIKGQQVNEKILNFTNLFITKVLKANNEVSFEDRLKLENGVRALEDQTILNQWNKFVESKTPEDAQREVKDLLEMLVNKIKN